MKRRRRILIWLLAVPVILTAGLAWVLWGGVSNPANRLQGRGAHMKYYDGSLAYGQYFGYAVLDLPMISKNEQCCDAVQRMRSEFLYSKGRYSDIHFESFKNGTMRYGGGGNREAFHKYLRKVYDASNTSTLRHELKKKPLSEIAPGDVFVYEAGRGHSIGHAVLVADVAVNPKTGKKALMFAQSSTPALTMHIIRDLLHPIKSPWIILNESDDSVFISGIRFNGDDLRSW